MTDLTTGRLGSVSSVGESLVKGSDQDDSQRKKRRPPPAPPSPPEPGTDEGDDSTHEIDELA